MKWRGWLCSLLFVFLLLCVGGVIINQNNNVSAVSDYVVSFDSSTTLTDNQRYLCDSGNFVWRPCSNYKYVVFDFSGTSISSNQFNVNWGSSSFTLFPYLYDSVIYEISSSISVISIPRTFTNLGSVFVTVTLTETFPSGCSSPSGSLSITENGTYDVTNYAEAVVDVPVPDPEIIPGDYHDDLVSINNAILIVPAVALVVYFFYAIYKMLLGGKTL